MSLHGARRPHAGRRAPCASRLAAWLALLVLAWARPALAQAQAPSATPDLGAEPRAADALYAPYAPDAPGAAPSADALDILDAALELARRDRPRLDAAAVRAQLDALVAAWRLRAPPGSPPERRARAFAEALFEDAGFRSVDDLSDADALHLDSVLARREGYCLSLSVVALAMAQTLGEPLHAVALPNHVLVRWDDGQQHFNLELTRRGELVDDLELRERLGPFGREDGLYLRALSHAEVAAMLLHNRGFAALCEGRLDAARADLLAATERLPGLAEAWRNLGVLHGEAGEWSAAIRGFGRALALHPGDADALLNLALARAGSGDLRAALEDLEVLALLAPGHPRLAELRAGWSRQLAAQRGIPALDDPPAGLRPGLQVRWFRDARLQREQGASVLRDLDLDAGRGAPRRGLPSDGSSARLSGWLRAPEDGVYTVFAVSNDGLRLVVDDVPVLDHWRDVGFTSWQGVGEVHLLAGWHRLRVEWFDSSGNARLFVKIAVEGHEYPLDLRECLFHVAAD